jgi:hypothetical protein
MFILCQESGKNGDMMMQGCRPLGHGVSKGVEDGCLPPALQEGHPRNGCKPVLGVAHPQGIEGLGMVGPGETLGNPWLPLGIRACKVDVGMMWNPPEVQ